MQGGDPNISSIRKHLLPLKVQTMTGHHVLKAQSQGCLVGADTALESTCQELRPQQEENSDRRWCYGWMSDR